MIHIEEPTLSMYFHGQQVAVRRQVRQIRNVPPHPGDGSIRNWRSTWDSKWRRPTPPTALKCREEGSFTFLSSSKICAGKAMNWPFPSRRSSCAGAITDQVQEPIEEVVLSVPDEYSGSVISKLNVRKGMMQQMHSENGFIPPGIPGADKRTAGLQK